MIISEHKTRAATVAMLYQGGAQSHRDAIPAMAATLYQSLGMDEMFYMKVNDIKGGFCFTQ